MSNSLTDVDFGGKYVSVQNIWDALPSLRYNAILFAGISILSCPIEVFIYFHPVFTTGTLTWTCLPDTECQYLYQIYNNTGTDVRCLVNDKTQWYYTSTQETSVQEFDWICDREFYYTLFSSLYFVGYLLGLPLSGALSDWYGRSKSHLITISIVFLALLFMSMAPTAGLVLAAQVLLGFGGGSMWLISYTRRMELIPSQYRNKFMCSLSVYETLSFLFALFLSLWLANWRHALLMAALLTTVNLALLAYPESPQYYAATNQPQSAKALLQYFAFNNSAEIRNYNLDQDMTSSRKKLSYLDLMFKNKTVSLYFFVMAFAWFSASLVAYSIQYIALNLPGDGLLNFVLIMQVPMMFSVAGQLLVVDYFGRKACLLASFLVSGLGLIGGIIINILHIDNWIINLAVFGVTKVSSGISFSLVYLITTELFPTILRQQALSGCSTVARLGSISGPLLSYLNKTSPNLSLMLLIGVCVVATGLVMFAIPETKGKPLLDSFEDVVNYETVGTYEKLPLIKEGSASEAPSMT